VRKVPGQFNCRNAAARLLASTEICFSSEALVFLKLVGVFGLGVLTLVLDHDFLVRPK